MPAKGSDKELNKYYRISPLFLVYILKKYEDKNLFKNLWLDDVHATTSLFSKYP